MHGQSKRTERTCDIDGVRASERSGTKAVDSAKVREGSEAREEEQVAAAEKREEGANEDCESQERW
jgi:hypothetical protein